MSTAKDPIGKFWCEHCESYQPEADMVGDDEPICQSCYEDRLESYKDAFEEQAGRPMEAIDTMMGSLWSKGGHCNIRQWNHATREYQDYQPDPSWNVVLYSADMGLDINCTACGKPMKYGDGYTSRELHNPFGLGFPVCSDCYELERGREQTTQQRKEDDDA